MPFIFPTCKNSQVSKPHKKGEVCEKGQNACKNFSHFRTTKHCTPAGYNRFFRLFAGKEEKMPFFLLFPPFMARQKVPKNSSNEQTSVCEV